MVTSGKLKCRIPRLNSQPLEKAEELFCKLFGTKPEHDGNIAEYCKTHSLHYELFAKPRGWFEIRQLEGSTQIIVHRRGKPVEHIFCLSPGHANQLRQRLSDAGMAGLVEYAL